MLNGKHIVLAVTGGIAAYKACELVRLYKKQRAQVRVVMTENAAKFVSPLTFETLSGNQVAIDTFAHCWDIEHISLAKFADICVVAPATANILAKIRAGLADDLVSTAIMAMPCRVLIAPAMNTVMWKSTANQENVKTLRERGYDFIGPGRGELACGDSDEGRMSEPEEIFEATKRLLCPRQDLKGLKVLVTAGATREMIDPVRFLTNRSTGKMGYAISEAARDRGAEVTLVSGKTELDKPDHVSRQEVISTQDMYDAVTALAPENDIVIQAAAPADFTPAEYKSEKIKKTGNCLTLRLVNTKDIAAAIGENKQPEQVFVAFAAETDADREKADQKRIRKNADLIVLNDISVPGAGFGTDTNIVTLISDDEITQHPLLTKREVADLIIDKVLDIRRAKGCATQK